MRENGFSREPAIPKDEDGFQKAAERAAAMTPVERNEIMTELVSNITDVKKLGTKEEKARVLGQLERLLEIYRNAGNK